MRAQDMLADHQNTTEIRGTTVRKGTVGAFLANAAVFVAADSPPAARAAARRDIADALPALQALGLFELLEIRDAGLRSFVQACLATPGGARP